MQLIKMKALREKLGGRSRSSIYNDLAAGRLPQPMKIGACLYWDIAEVDAMLEESRA